MVLLYIPSTCTAADWSWCFHMGTGGRTASCAEHLYNSQARLLVLPQIGQYMAACGKACTG